MQVKKIAALVRLLLKEFFRGTSLVRKVVQARSHKKTILRERGEVIKKS
jgi:hypothetical protein